MNNPQSVSLPFRLKKPTNVIEFRVPYPTQPVKDARLIGLGLVRLNVRPLVAPEASQEARPLLAGPAKTQECKSFIEAGIIAASVPEAGPSAPAPTVPPDPGAPVPGADGRPAWRRVARSLIRRARPVLLPFSHRFRGHVRTAIEETAVLPQLSQVMAELTSLRQEIVSLRGALDSHVRHLKAEAKADRATLGEMAAVLSEALNRADGLEVAAMRPPKTVEALAKTPELLPVDGP
jgi:hypothetical protein